MRDLIELYEEHDDVAMRRMLEAGGLESSFGRQLRNYMSVRKMHEGHDFPSVKVEYVARDGHLGRRAVRVCCAEDRESMTSLTTMLREVRAWAAHGLYHDVDMENAQPSLALQLCRKHGIEAPALEDYVENREARLEEVKLACEVSREEAKQLFLRIAFLGSADAWAAEARAESSTIPSFVRALQREYKRSMALIVAEYPAAVEQQRRQRPDSSNPLATAASYVLQDVERRCLDALHDAVVASGLRVGALIYDGLLVRRGDNIDLLPRSLLEAWEASVLSETGFTVHLKEKAWDLKGVMVGPVTSAVASLPPPPPIEARLLELGLLRRKTCNFQTLPLDTCVEMMEVPRRAAAAALPADLADRRRVVGAGYLQRLDVENADRLYVLLSREEDAEDAVLLGIDPVSLVLSVDGRENVASLKAVLPTDIDISCVHQCIESALTWFVHAQTPSCVSFSGYRPGVATPSCTVEVSNPFAGSHSLVGARVTGVAGVSSKVITNRSKLAMLQEVLMKTLDRARDLYGITPIINIYENCFNTNNTSITNTTASEPAPNNFEILCEVLLKDAEEHGYRKADETVYAPIAGCPCAYARLMSYKEYLNAVLKHRPEFRRTTRVFDELVKFLINYRVDEMPELVRDQDLLSFRDGVLELSSLRFTAYEGMDAAMLRRCARHHIEGEYGTGTSLDCPLFEHVLSSQFHPDVAELLCALLGRLLFPVGKLDNWQVMPFLVGLGSTGKSLILLVMQKLFSPGAYGNLSGARREEIFGLANLHDKEVIFGRDMPARLSGLLPQELMQSMTTGEDVEVPRKGLRALQVPWTAPMVMASNHMPDYVNVGNNVGRRLVVFKFGTAVRSPREDLLGAIVGSELPGVVRRTLRAYHASLERAREAGGFWRMVPPVILEWQSSLAAATNKLYSFLTMEDSERGCAIACVEGRVTWLSELKGAYERAMGCKLGEVDASVLEQLGYTLGDKYEHVCLACKQIARSRGGSCCPLYNNVNRDRKRVIYNMELI